MPVFTENDIPVTKQMVIPLLRLHDDEFWGSMRSINRVDLAMIDPLHWYYDDQIFEEYIGKLSQINFPAICLFESPFLEKPPGVSFSRFEKKLYERTKLAAQIIRGSSKSIIVSPAMGLLEIDLQERYLEYFVHNRSHFDVYALHCCCDYKEQTISLITSFLHQIVNMLSKPVWITRWAIPSCEHEIENRHSLASSSWSPMNHTQASQRMRKVFAEVEDVCKSNTRWFFVGVGQDAYHPLRNLPNVYWDARGPAWSLTVRSKELESWDFEHFIGSVTFNDKIKEPVLKAFMSIAQEQNGEAMW